VKGQTSSRALGLHCFVGEEGLITNFSEGVFMQTIKDIMTTEVACTTPDTSLTEVARLMVEFECGEVPLVENFETKKVIGVITDRDIVCRTLGIGKNPMVCTAADCMTTPSITVNESMSVEDCLDLMKDNQIRRVPVVDKNGILSGIVSQVDLVDKVDEAVKVIQEVSKPGQTLSQIH
jgi:CBS domain-containing protein